MRSTLASVARCSSSARSLERFSVHKHRMRNRSVLFLKAASWRPCASETNLEQPLARRPMGITAPFERGEIGPDLFARHAASNLRALCLNIAIGRIAAACKSSGSRSKTQPSCDKSGTMTVWIYDQGEDLNVLA